MGVAMFGCKKLGYAGVIADSLTVKKFHHKMLVAYSAIILASVIIANWSSIIAKAGG